MILNFQQTRPSGKRLLFLCSYYYCLNPRTACMIPCRQITLFRVCSKFVLAPGTTDHFTELYFKLPLCYWDIYSAICFILWWHNITTKCCGVGITITYFVVGYNFITPSQFIFWSLFRLQNKGMRSWQCTCNERSCRHCFCPKEVIESTKKWQFLEVYGVFLNSSVTYWPFARFGVVVFLISVCLCDF